MTPIAVVGIDCRFPGAPDKDAFWRLLMDGVVTDTEVPSQRWDVDTYYHPDGAAGSMNTRRAHFIDDVDAFDNDFFGIAPIEAAALDPQQRLLLQTSWRALEDAGIDPRSLAGTPTGVFVGMMSSEWTSLQMLDFPEVTAFRGAGSGYFMTANRISYHLNLTGPSMAIDSACSSSLMAVHQGCAALRAGEADTVIAAGANLLLTPALSIFYTQAGLSAPDGRCKPFGQGADGIGRGEGVAAVVLRRLDDAIADGQPIYAVVKSSVANHDGRSNGITAPNRRSQVELMRRALSARRGRGRTDRLRRSTRHRHFSRRHDRGQRAGRYPQGARRRAMPAGFGQGKHRPHRGQCGDRGVHQGVSGAAPRRAAADGVRRQRQCGIAAGRAWAAPGRQCAAVAGARGAGRGELIRTGRQQRARGAGVGAGRGATRPGCDRCPDAVGALRAGAAAQRRFDRHRAGRPRRSAGGLLVPRHQRREAIAASSPCAGRQPRHAGRWAAGVSRRRPAPTWRRPPRRARSRPESGSCAQGRGRSTRA